MDTIAIFSILAVIAAFVIAWSFDAAGRIGEVDIERDDSLAESQGYVDQDGEATPARHQWVNAGAKAPHVE
jgi:hypothetical protein